MVKWLNMAKNAFARRLLSQAGAANKSAAQHAATHSCPFHSRALVVSNLAVEATIQGCGPGVYKPRQMPKHTTHSARSPTELTPHSA